MTNNPARVTQRRTCRLWLWLTIAAGLAALGLPFLDRTVAADPPGLAATEQVHVLPLYGYNGPATIMRNQLVIDPVNSQVMYWAVAGLGVLKSTDRGVTWGPKNYGLPSLATRAIVMDPGDPNHLLVGFDGHTTAQGPWPYRTRDAGERWEPTVLCEREGKKENLRQQASCELLAFDTTAPNWFYYLIFSQVNCGGFYRSCDQGASYDRNPFCITFQEATSPEQSFQRPACAAGLLEPINSFSGNDASLLSIDPRDGALFVANGVHPEDWALMTSLNKGGYFNFQDVVDSTGKSFVPASQQGVISNFAQALALAPSNPDARYAAITTLRRVCLDGLAHPGPCAEPVPAATQPRLVVRWTGLYSNGGPGSDCSDTNDCDGDTAPDRVWEPIFNGTNRPSMLDVRSILVHPTQPDRIFVTGYGGPSELLMLTPGASGQEWQATLVYAQFNMVFDRIVQDPGDPASIYLLAHGSYGYLPTIIRFTADASYQTWQRTDLVTTTDFFHVFDLVETRGSAGHRIVASTTGGRQVGNELGSSWTNQDSTYYTQEAALTVAPTDPNLAFGKRTWAVAIGTSGFEGMSDMDDVSERRDVMCTNVFNDMAVDPANSATLYAATGAGIWKQPNAHVPANPADKAAIGRAWQSFARTVNGLADEYVWSLAFDPNRTDHSWMLAGTRSGAIYQSLDFGSTWSAASINVPGPVQSLLKDVRDIQYLGTKGFAATGAGVLQRRRFNQPWSASMTGDRIARLAIGASGANRLYAAGDLGLYRTRNAGSSWESLAVVPRPPYSSVLETTSLDGRHHLWVPDYRAGLYRISTTVRARPGASTQSVILEWTHSAGQPTPAGYELHYGSDPDLFGGTGASQGNSPIVLGSVTTATLSGLNFQATPRYVALTAIDGTGQRGPIGLPLRIEFGYVFSPAITVTQAPGCATGLRIGWPAIPEATGYKLYRRENAPGTSYALRATITGGQTVFDDTSVTAGTAYEYYATAILPLGETSGGDPAAGTPTGDFDRDGVKDICDNCPYDYNPSQNFVGAPYVEVIFPNGGEVLPVGTPVNLQWYAEDSCGGVASVDLSISRNGVAGPWQSIATGIPNTGSRTWTPVAPGSAQSLFKVVARDPAGNVGSDVSDAPFTIQQPCGLCQIEYCTGVEIGCRATGQCGPTGCCYYQCGVTLPNCIDSECPPNVCGGCGGH
jgi:hypothetical protein